MWDIVKKFNREVSLATRRAIFDIIKVVDILKDVWNLCTSLHVNVYVDGGSHDVNNDKLCGLSQKEHQLIVVLRTIRKC